MLTKVDKIRVYATLKQPFCPLRLIAFLIFGKDKNFFFILTLYFGYTNDIDRAKDERRMSEE